MSGATNDADALRISLEAIQAAHLQARDCLLVAITRLAQRARTHDEAEIIEELITAREALRTARARLADLLPDHCERPIRSRD
jgi:hypothetical protein